MRKVYTIFKAFSGISILILFIFFGKYSQAQLAVTTTMTPQQLVQNVLVGTGVTVSNITYSGVPNSIGRFTTGASPTNLGLASGIIISSGVVNGTPAIGSPGSDFASTNNLGGSDPQLAGLVTSTIYDAAVLQFDFVPLSDTIKFRYVFGSEEYPEYVGSSFNDVFGFFVSGPNPLGGNYTNLNIAKIPGTALPVTINNVNSGSYSQYYINNGSGATIVYDGFTTVLTAWCRVVPCLTYHLKIALGDAGDGVFDSGVFLQENSFSATSVTIQTTFSNPSASTTNTIEGCNNAVVTFSLPSATTTPFPISYSISGTATNGVDYAAVPNSVIIPAGQSSVSITISPILDGVNEPQETVILTVQTSVCGGTQTITINIDNNDPMTAISSNDTLICGTSADIWVQASGGITPYTYQWSNGINTSNQTVAPTSTTVYNVTVTDLCGSTVTESVTISVGSSNANAGPDQEICYGQSATINAVGGNTFLWSTGETTSSILVNPLTTTTYYVTVTDACPSYDTVTIVVNPLPNIVATASPQSIILGNSTTICGQGGVSYTWTSSPPDATLSGQNTNTCATVTPQVTTTYFLVGIDSNGCQNSTSIVVTVIPIYPEVDFWGEPLSGCAPLRVQFYDNSDKTLPGATYYWDFGNGTFSYDKDPLAYYTEPGTYSISLTVTNPNNMASTLIISDYVTVYKNPVAMFSTSPENVTNILNPSFLFYDNSIGIITDWYWTFGDGNFDTHQNTYHLYSDGNYYYQFPLMEDTGTYLVTLIVTTDNGCKDTASKTVKIEPAHSVYIPTAFTPNEDEKNQEFCIRGFGIIEEDYSLVIFNRWGQQVFFTNSINECWNGKLNGTNAENGTYVYKLIYKDTQQIKHIRKGIVTLFR